MSNGNAWSNALAAANATTTRRPPRKVNVTIDHAERVLFCLHLNNPFRKLCIKFVEWK
jgi:hypothetical protein